MQQSNYQHEYERKGEKEYCKGGGRWREYKKNKWKSGSCFFDTVDANPQIAVNESGGM